MNYTMYKDQPLELLFDQVDREVDSSLGRSKEVVKDSKNRSQTYLTFALLSKYSLMFDIVRNLGGEFKLLKECILKEITKS